MPQTLLLFAIVVLLAVGVTAAVVRESRDDQPTAAPTPTTIAPSGPLTTSSQPIPTTTGTTVPPVPTTTAPAMGAPAVPSPAAPPSSTPVPSPTGPTATTVPSVPSTMPNTGGLPSAGLGLGLVVSGLGGWRLSRRGCLKG